MQQKMFKVMWATMALSLVAFCANPAMAQDSGMGDTQVVTTTADLDTADFDGGVVDCDTRSDCQKAEQALADAKVASDTAEENRKNLHEAQLAATNDFTDLLKRTPPPTAAEQAAALRNTNLLAIAAQDAATVARAAKTALESAETAKEAACATRGFQLLPNWEIDPDVIDRNPTIPAMPSPDFQVDAELGQFDAQGSSANSG